MNLLKRKLFPVVYICSKRSLNRSARLAAFISPQDKASLEKPDLLSGFDVNCIRNFSIIAHVDHGKSTLSDRLLEFTGTIEASEENAQVLDKLLVERERGITVKAQTASMIYERNGTRYLLNLIDTPGHVDFSYEVCRSLSASDGALLLIDAKQGVEAQTVAHFFEAFERELKIIPVINKIDLKDANPERVAEEVFKTFELLPEECLKVSAKLGTGISGLLDAIVKNIPHPKAQRSAPLRAYIFDSWFEHLKGAYAFVLVKDGFIESGQKIVSSLSKKVYEVLEVGVMKPNPTPVLRLYAGQVGYVLGTMKTPKDAIIGDTLAWSHSQDVVSLPSLKPSKPTVFAGLFPFEISEYDSLKAALEKLCLNDPAVTLEADSSTTLGKGWKTGFLGVLHMEVFQQRLEDEYDAIAIITAPSVTYKARLKPNDRIRKMRYEGKDEVHFISAHQFPAPSDVEEYLEPVVNATLITPVKYEVELEQLCRRCRTQLVERSYINDDRVILKCTLSLAEIIDAFFTRVKSLSSGYASFDYEDAGWKPAPIVKVDVLLNGNIIPEFSFIVHRSKATQKAREVCLRLKEQLPIHQFDIKIQAAIGHKVIGRQDLKAEAKDVLAKGGKQGNFGGDFTRKLKVLEKQRSGKEQLKRIGQINIPKEVFSNVVRSQ